LESAEEATLTTLRVLLLDSVPQVREAVRQALLAINGSLSER
jgi:hypothetical protein